MKTERFSINWGKGAIIFALVAVVIVLFFFVMGLHFVVRMDAPIAVDWGNSVTPVCPRGMSNCNVAVDWGNSVTPACPRGQKNCGNVAVDWGNSVTPACLFGQKNCDKVAWSPPVIPKGTVSAMVDWGS